MSLKRLLSEECTILVRTVNNTGKTATESWSAQAEPVKCRKITRESHVLDPTSSQYSTKIRTRFMLPLTATLSIRDRIEHGGRAYEVVEVVPSLAPKILNHKVAICEAVV